MSGMIIAFQQTTIGRVAVVQCGDAISNLCFATESVPQQAEIGETELIREAYRQIDAYLAGELRLFSVRLAPSGTPFMQRVWNVLSTIPYGTTATYRDIAAAAGKPLAVRLGDWRNAGIRFRFFFPVTGLLPVMVPLVAIAGGRGWKKGCRRLNG